MALKYAIEQIKNVELSIFTILIDPFKPNKNAWISNGFKINKPFYSYVLKWESTIELLKLALTCIKYSSAKLP